MPSDNLNKAEEFCKKYVDHTYSAVDRDEMVQEATQVLTTIINNEKIAFAGDVQLIEAKLALHTLMTNSQDITIKKFKQHIKDIEATLKKGL